MQGRSTVPTSLVAIAAVGAQASVSEEPGAVIPHAGICAGEGGQLPSLPRQATKRGAVSHLRLTADYDRVLHASGTVNPSSYSQVQRRIAAM